MVDLQTFGDWPHEILISDAVGVDVLAAASDYSVTSNERPLEDRSSTRWRQLQHGA